MGRTTTALLLAVVLATAGACGADDCTKVRGAGELKVQVPTVLQKLVRTLRVELCQGTNCGSVNFSSRTAEATGKIQDGITLDGDAYVVDLDQLGTGWKPGVASGLTILGTTRRGRVVIRHVEQFTFDAFIPDGEDCDQEPTLTHATGISGDDLTD